MSDYPEHDKLSAVAAETQAAGEFIEWLESRGIHLMTWREDLVKDYHTPDTCRGPADGEDEPECRGRRGRTHCTHWIDEQADCHRCGRGQMSQGKVSAWTSPGKGLLDLLAEWTDIDRAKIEAEKRAILASVRAAQSGEPQ